MSNQILAQMPLPVEGVDLRADLALVIPTPASQQEAEALSWFLSQQPDATLDVIVRAHQDAQYWQQRDAQAALDGGW